MEFPLRLSKTKAKRALFAAQERVTPQASTEITDGFSAQFPPEQNDLVVANRQALVRELPEIVVFRRRCDPRWTERSPEKGERAVNRTARCITARAASCMTRGGRRERSKGILVAKCFLGPKAERTEKVLRVGRALSRSRTPSGSFLDHSLWSHFSAISANSPHRPRLTSICALGTFEATSLIDVRTKPLAR